MLPVSGAIASHSLCYIWEAKVEEIGVPSGSRTLRINGLCVVFMNGFANELTDGIC